MRVVVLGEVDQVGDGRVDSIRGQVALRHVATAARAKQNTYVFENAHNVSSAVLCADTWRRHTTSNAPGSSIRSDASATEREAGSTAWTVWTPSG